VAAARRLESALRRDARDGAILAERIEVLPQTVDARTSAASVVAEIDQLRLRRPDDGRVQAAAGLAFQRLGELDRSEAAFRAALDADAPPAPPGTGINAARLLLAKATADEAAARAAMEADPSLYEDPTALSLYIGILEPKAHLERAPELEDVLTTLERDRADAAGRRARWALARGTPAAALRLADAWTEAAPGDPRAWLLRGLTGSMVRAAAPETAAGDDRQEAAPYREAMRVSAHPQKTRATATRLLGWFGIPPGALDDAPPSAGAGAD
jgi:tetratricopeptide (TPR) repeat protein